MKHPDKTKNEVEVEAEEWAVDFEPQNFLSKLPDPENIEQMVNDPEAVLLGISSYKETDVDDKETPDSDDEKIEQNASSESPTDSKQD